MRQGTTTGQATSLYAHGLRLAPSSEPQPERVAGATLTIIAPSRNEEESATLLAEAVRRALDSTAYELLFVDDSDDATPQVLQQLAEREDLHVRFLHRARGPERWGGLSGAVVDGLKLATGAYACIIDADLQHPPEKIPELLRAAQEHDADVVMACRYIPGGSSEGLDGPLRTLFSLGCKWLAKILFPRRLRGVHDPLSGFLLIKRSITRDVSLQPIGFKISLELLIRCPRQRFVEVPYRFRRRARGTSKADFRVGTLYLQHLGRLRFF
ncbi:MAG: polyprenol monophosphomannose synthase [Chloroflexi bacterium]|nr:polyprenol monophosphomannose synthase [Chloroflexota bacterium]